MNQFTIFADRFNECAMAVSDRSPDSVRPSMIDDATGDELYPVKHVVACNESDALDLHYRGDCGL